MNLGGFRRPKGTASKSSGTSIAVCFLPSYRSQNLVRFFSYITTGILRHGAHRTVPKRQENPLNLVIGQTFPRRKKREGRERKNSLNDSFRFQLLFSVIPFKRKSCRRNLGLLRRRRMFRRGSDLGLSCLHHHYHYHCCRCRHRQLSAATRGP